MSKPKSNKKKDKLYGKKNNKKQTIPKALREQLWVRNFGKVYQHKCYVDWCDNNITVFDFHVGHDKPESKGGTLSIENLKPLCSRCNQSMGNQFTIKEWNKMMSPSKQKTPWWCC